jgi:Fe-S-cluster-containing dehydrogenase component
MQFDDDREAAVKCDLCVERLQNHEQPACTKACAARCILWGDTKRISEILAARRTMGPLEDLTKEIK